MRVVVLALAALALSWSPLGAWRGKPPEVQVITSSAHRTDGKVVLDGRVRNAAEKPIQGLVLVFDFLAPEKTVVTTQKSTIDEEVLAPGKEATFHFELDDPVRAVRFQLSAVDASGRDLRVANTGPFVIE